MSVGIGIVTYKRPAFFEKVIAGVMEHVQKEVDYIIIYNDGSFAFSYEPIYQKIKESPKVQIIHAPKNHGVAFGKNVLLKTLMDLNCDYLFLSEDDNIPLTPQCITAYVEASIRTGIEHFNYAHHGIANRGGPIYGDDGLEYYPACVGAWSFYTRNVIETVGYMDENFYNAIDHIEHTWRIANVGLTSQFWKFVDVYDSGSWFEEIGGRQDSIIGGQSNWLQNIDNAKAYWRSKNPDCPI